MKYKVKGTTKGTLFCVHGNSSSAKVFKKLLNSTKILNSKISVDLQGHGKNQNKAYGLGDFTFESYKEYLLNELSKINGDILLIGNSLGGHLAIEIANEIKNLKGLVIMGTPPVKKPINFEEAFIPVEALNTYFTENPSEREVNEATNITVNNKTKRKIIVSDFKKANSLVRTAIAIDITQNKLLDEFSLFANLTIPKYIIAGDTDPSVNREYLEYVKNSCQHNCEIVDYKNCGHFPSIDKPKKFINTISKIAKEVFKQ